DGRDLWSSRVTLQWQPVEGLTADFIWEHFSENDDLLRSSKQLCKTAPTPNELGGVILGGGGGVGILGDVPYADYFRQGCLPVSLHSPQAFEVPNGFSLPYILAGAGGM